MRRRKIRETEVSLELHANNTVVLPRRDASFKSRVMVSLCLLGCSALSLVELACRHPQEQRQYPEPTPTIALKPDKIIRETKASYQYTGTNQIAFISDRDGTEKIYIMNADGSSQRRVAPTDNYWGRYGSSNYNIFNPRWSPDGKQILFTMRRSFARTYNFYIFVMGTGSGLRKVASREFTREWLSATGDFLNARWSPDGKKIVYNGISSVNTDGSGLRELTSGGFDPRWSPDGKQIAFTGLRDHDSEIYVMDADGSNRRNLTNSPNSDDRDPSWSPDGTKILYCKGDFRREVHVMDTDGSNRRNLTNSPNSDDRDPSWSPK